MPGDPSEDDSLRCRLRGEEAFPSVTTLMLADRATRQIAVGGQSRPTRRSCKSMTDD